MNKKIIIGVVVVLIIIVIAVIASRTPRSEKIGEDGQPIEENVSQAELDKSMDSTIESLKSTCTVFLTGDLSGDPKNDCPGFDQSMNVSLCYYCYAVKDMNGSLCGEINNDVALRSLCQKVNGLPIDNLNSQ